MQDVAILELAAMMLAVLKEHASPQLASILAYNAESYRRASGSKALPTSLESLESPGEAA